MVKSYLCYDCERPLGGFLMARLVIQETDTYHIQGWYRENDDIALCGRIVLENGSEDECTKCETLYSKRGLDKFFEDTDYTNFCKECGQHVSYHSDIYLNCPDKSELEASIEKNGYPCNDVKKHYTAYLFFCDACGRPTCTKCFSDMDHLKVFHKDFLYKNKDYQTIPERRNKL